MHSSSKLTVPFYDRTNVYYSYNKDVVNQKQPFTDFLQNGYPVKIRKVYEETRSMETLS